MSLADTIIVSCKRVFDALSIDKAVMWALGRRSLQLLTGAGTIVIIAIKLTPVEQGFFYTFSSIVALQMLVELGFTYVLVQFTSHEKAHLAWTENGCLTGNPESKLRLSSLTRLAVKWYGLAAILFVSILIPSGLAFLSSSKDCNLVHNWRLAWVCVVFATGCTLYITPFLSIAEGCGLIVEVIQVRTIVDVLGYLALWCFLWSDCGLLSVAFLPVLRFFGSLYWLSSKMRIFFYDLLFSPLLKYEHRISWRNEIYPLQWRVALTWVSSFLVYQLFTPILFKYKGARVAGQMGMTLNVCMALFSLGISWMTTKAPILGVTVAKKNYAIMDRTFSLSLRGAVLFVVPIGVVLTTGLVVLNQWDRNMADRMLDPVAFILILLATIMQLIFAFQSIYLRAFKVEPLWWLSGVAGILIGVSTYITGRYFEVFYVALGYACVTFAVCTLCGSYYFYIMREKLKR